MGRSSEDHVDRILEQWARERPSLDASPIAVVGRIFRASRFLESGLEEVFGRFGLTRGEFDTLASLLRSGRPYRLTPSGLSKGLLISNGTATYRVDALELAGLVRRFGHPEDRRGILVELTPRGRKVARSAVDATLAVEARLLSSLDDGRRARLADDLKALLRGLEPEGGG